MSQFRSISIAVLVILQSVAFLCNATSDPQKLFDEGMQARSRGDLAASIRAFEKMLKLHPNLQRARLELAVAYFQALNFKEARRYAESVLSNPATPEPVKIKIREFLTQVKVAGPKHTFKPYIGVGYLSDSNANAGPDPSVVVGFPTISVTTKASDHALLYQGGFVHRYLPGITTNIGGTPAGVLWINRLGFSRTDYSNLSSQDLDILSLSSGPNFIAVNKWRGALNLQWDSLRLGQDSYADLLAINPSFTLLRNRNRTEYTIETIVQQRTYKRAIDLGRDSSYLSLGAGYGRYTVTDKWFFQVGARVFKEDADYAYYSNDGMEVSAGLTYQISKESLASLKLSRRWSEYQDIEPGFTNIRDESLDRIVIGFTKKMTRTGFLKGWEFKAGWSYSQNQSNIDLFDYDRRQLEFSIMKIFE